MNDSKNKICKYTERIHQERVLFLIPFLGNVILSLFMKYPIITDEYNTLSEGLFLTGYTDLSETFNSLYNTGYYGWGYVILYSWTYKIFKDINIVYHIGLIVNSFFASLIPMFSYKIATKFWKLDSSSAFWISGCLCFYPAYIVYSKYAMNETILAFLIWPLLYLLLDFYKLNYKRRVVTSFALGGLATYAYAIHGRGLAIFCVTFLVFGMLIFFSTENISRKICEIFVFFLATVIVYILNSIIKNYIAVSFVGSTASDLANTTENFLSFSFFKSLIGVNSIRILYGFLGQTFYITVTTLGLAAVAVVLTIRILYKGLRERKIDSTMILSIFTVGLMSATLIISVLFFSNLYITEAIRGSEYYVYGRYNEITCGMLIFFVLISYMKFVKDDSKLAKYSLVLNVFLMAGGIFVAVRKILQSYNPRLSYTMVIGMVPLSGEDLYLDPTIFSYIKVIVFTFILFIILLTCLHFSRIKTASVLLSIFFLYSTFFSLINFVFPQSKNNYKDVEQLSSFNDILDDNCDKILKDIYILDSDVPKPRMAFAFQDFTVKYMENVQYNYGQFEDIKEDSLFVSKKEEYIDYIFDEIYYVKEIPGFYVWGYGDQLRACLEDIGYECTERENSTLFFAGEELSLLNRPDNFIETKGDSIVIPTNGLQFGPYCSLKKGKYRVDIYGKNLNNGDYYAYFNAGFNDLTTYIQSMSPNHVQYDLYVNEFSDSIEFLCENTGDTYIIIDYVVISLVEDYPTTSINNAGDVYIRNRFYDVSDGYRNFESYIKLNADCINSWRYIRLNPQGELTIQNLPMAKGINYLSFEGTNINFSDISIVDGDGNELPLTYLTLDDNLVSFQINCLTNITIKIANNINESIDFESLEIRWKG